MEGNHTDVSLRLSLFLSLSLKINKLFKKKKTLRAVESSVSV